MMPSRYGHEPDQEYTAFVERAFIDGIKAARGKLEPARMFAGTGYSSANINRRARDPRGRISLGLNPDGPTDRQIGLIRLERPDGPPLVSLAQVGMGKKSGASGHKSDHGRGAGGRGLLPAEGKSAGPDF